MLFRALATPVRQSVPRPWDTAGFFAEPNIGRPAPPQFSWETVGPSHSAGRSTGRTAPRSFKESSSSSRYAVPDTATTHRAAEAWHTLYKLELGVIPTPEQCRDAPESQKHLAQVPHIRASRKKCILGHFYMTVGENQQCQVKMEGGQICGKLYKSASGTRARKKHVSGIHRDLYTALMEFRSYQGFVQGIPVQADDDEDAPPTKPTYQPHPDEVDNFREQLIGLIAVKGVSFEIIGCDFFKALCKQLNQQYSIPSTDVLQETMADRVFSMMNTIKTYLHRHVRHVAITADCWTSVGQRKFFGVTLHFVTLKFEMASIVIGMEPISGPQTAERLQGTLGKY